MPLFFETPRTILENQAKITAIRIQAEPLSIVVEYDLFSGDGAPITSGAHAFGWEELSNVDPTGDAYQAVKNASYNLLKTRLGNGTIA